MRISDWSSDVCSSDLLQRQRGRPQPIAMLLNYGAFAPERTPSYARFGAGDYSLESDEMDAFWATYVDGPDQLSDPLVAPLRADLAGLPPAFPAIAECDILDRKSTRLNSSH